MVGGTPKPFACTSEGCTMTFTNEDHLNVHQRKHEMVLSLGIKSSSIVADQTPTPTRFLRNCEEVGLFQDLQNVNPFEETFRKATEIVKTTGSLPIPILTEDDTLHTPHIFPHLPAENVSLYKNSQKKDENITSSNLIENEKKVHTNIVSPDHMYAIEGNPTINIPDSPDKIPKHKSKEKNKTQDNKICKAKYRKYMDSATKLRALDKNINAKLKLQQVLLQAKEKTNTTVAPPIILVQSVPVVNGLSTTKPILPKIETIPPPKISLNSDEKTFKQHKSSNTKKSNNDSKKCDLKERNRAAALRCRERKKIFFGALEEKLDVVNKEKLELEKEISVLHKEIIRLKTLLLAHRDCPVTKAMNMGQSIPLGLAQIVEVATDNGVDIKDDLLNPGNSSNNNVIITITNNVQEKTDSLVWED